MAAGKGMGILSVALEHISLLASEVRFIEARGLGGLKTGVSQNRTILGNKYNLLLNGDQSLKLLRR